MSADEEPVPSPNSLLSSLLSNLAGLSDRVTASHAHIPNSSHNTEQLPLNPLSTLSSSPQAKSILITLHCLLPHLFLPALDVLDRRLVTRFIVTDEAQDGSEASLQDDPKSFHLTVYHVKSGATMEFSEEQEFIRSAGNATNSKGKKEIPSLIHEVRLRAWNCTCAAFVFASLEQVDSINPSHIPWDSLEQSEGNEIQQRIARSNTAMLPARKLGGMRRTRAAYPLCKHLLACLLAESWPSGLGAYVEEQNRSGDQLAASVV